MGCWIVIEEVAMVDSLVKIGESFVCLGREMVFLCRVSSLGMIVCLIWSLRLRFPACLASCSLSSESLSCSSTSSVVGLSMSKLWMLVRGCYNLGSPIFELCTI